MYIYAMLFEYGEFFYVALDWLYVNFALDFFLLFLSIGFYTFTIKNVIHNKYNDRLRSWEKKGVFFSFF